MIKIVTKNTFTPKVERNPKTVTKHIVMLNFIDRTNLEKMHLHLCKKKKNTMGTEEN
jgi:hypothetical protein